MRKHLKTENIISVCVLSALGWLAVSTISVMGTQATIVERQVIFKEEHENLHEYRDTIIRIDTNMEHIVSKLDNVEKQVLCSLKATQEAQLECL